LEGQANEQRFTGNDLPANSSLIKISFVRIKVLALEHFNN